MVLVFVNTQQYYAPDFELNVRSSNMENSNSREYLEKITSAVIDNLRQTGPAPSVQMQDVPRRPFGGMTDEEEAELDDLDEDENKDVRMTEHRWDKHVEDDAEFEASDDEDMSRANGATRLGSNKRTLADYRKADMDVDSGNASPANGTNGTNGAHVEPTVEDAPDANDDTIEDITVADEASKDTAQEAREPSQPEKDDSKVDGDGDVGMTDSAAAEEPTATIKTEEVEPETVPESTSDDKPTDEAAVAEAPPAPTVEEAVPEPKAADETATSEKAAEGADEPEKAQPKTEEAADAMEVDNDKEKPAEEKESTPAS